jgi:short-subunit dehydrogenase
VELDGKTVLLTGATGGLGRAIGEALGRRGATLVVSGRREDSLRELVHSLPDVGHRAVVSDLALEGAAERLAADAGEVDVLVANAGLPAGGRLERFTQEELTAALRVNLEAPVKLARELVPSMRERRSGHLVFISSLQGKIAFANSSVYTATKFGLRGFGLALRDELWASGVGVSIVLPGFIRDAGMFAKSGMRAPAGLGTSSPQEVGEAVATAIERNRGEVEVAPLVQRLGVAFAHRRPGIASRLTRGTAGRVAEDVVRGQRGNSRMSRRSVDEGR